MMMALAVAVVLPFVAQLLPGIHHTSTDWGPDTAVWPGLFAVWILCTISAVVFVRYKQLLAATPVTATLVTLTFLPVFSWGSLPAFWLLVGLAIPCLLAPRTSPRRSHRWFAFLVGGLVLGALVVASVGSVWFSTGGPEFYYQLVGFVPFVAGSVVACSLILLVARSWVLGSALLLLAVPWLLFASVGHGPLRASTTTSLVSVAVACLIGVGLLAAWLADLRNAHEPAG
jgi:hypothetical protein